MASSKRLSLASQAFSLRHAYPQGRGRIERGGRLVFDVQLQPTIASCTYSVRIEYALGRQPQVRVLDPPLRLREGASEIPHIYSANRICLHLPDEWTADMQIADTIAPWLSEWLAHYELWLATGTWLGGGHEATAPSEPESSRGSSNQQSPPDSQPSK
ncbi:hypothetical protein ACFYNO_20270 [Kitasatospora sp. NPDC006697]|uniref:hypothetical protein n=1 Tax=Kitasatospora sp. NPDC006697 TaxID=3364020 RepID=UPI00367EC46B